MGTESGPSRPKCWRTRAAHGSIALAGALLLFPASGRTFGKAELDRAAAAAERVDLIQTLADDAQAGRDNASRESASVQEVLIDALLPIAAGLDSSRSGRDAYRQPFGTPLVGTNLLGVIRGSELEDEYVMLGAHYDHLGRNGAEIFNGAQDNAAGVAAVLAIGAAIRALPGPPRRSIVLALWDAEEDRLAGSRAYTKAPLVPLRDTVAYINFDIQGANLLPSARDLSFAIASESGGTRLQQWVRDAIAEEKLDTRLLSEPFGRNRSDHASFIEAAVPTVFFSDATGPCYHTPADDLAVVDIEKLESQSRIAFRLTVALAQTAAPPRFVAPGPPHYDDAVVIAEVLERAVADIDLFSTRARRTLLELRSQVGGIAGAGRDAFQANQMAALPAAADAALELVRGLPCDGFLGRD